MEAYKNAYIRIKRDTIKIQIILKGPTSPHNFIKGWVITIQDFVAEVFGF